VQSKVRQICPGASVKWLNNNNNNNNNRTYIAPYGRNFRGAGSSESVSEQWTVLSLDLDAARCAADRPVAMHNSISRFWAALHWNERTAVTWKHQVRSVHQCLTSLQLWSLLSDCFLTSVLIILYRDQRSGSLGRN